MDARACLLDYAAAGVGSFPLHSGRGGLCTCGRRDCHSPAKHPRLGLAHGRDDPRRATCRGECGRVGHGLYDATTDVGQLEAWLTAFPGCNWGIRPPGGVLVLDVDPRNGGDAELAKLEAQHGALPGTLTARTGSGGLHIWLSYNGPARGKLCGGVDVKTSSGYLVAPPSMHICGGRYEWIDDRPAAYAPTWVKQLMNPPVVRRPDRPGRPGSGIAPLVRVVLDAGEGERNRRLFWAACRAHERGLDLAPLHEAGVRVGLTDSETRAALRSAQRATRAGGGRTR